MSQTLPHDDTKASGSDMFTRSLWRQQLAGLAMIVVFGGTLGYWATATHLTSAVATGGQFVAASDVKKVQHPTGGVVGALLVKDGDRVKAGDVLLRLDETVTRANLQVVTKQLAEFAVRRARLVAERDGQETIQLPPELADRAGDPAVQRLVAAENNLFQSRRSARAGQTEQLRRRIAQLKDEIRGLQSQQAGKSEEAKIIARQLVGVRDLYAKNLIQISQLSALERDAAANQGQTGQIIAGMAQTQGKISEIELQIIQIGEDLRADAMKELREIDAKEAELTERRTIAQDQLQRIDLRSPVSGTVHQLAVHTVGGVLNQGETAMYIVPGDDALQLDARVSPTDIDQITMGQQARLKVQAGNQRNNPELTGTVTRISADVTREERTGSVFYSVRVSVPQEEAARLEPLKLMAGMQAEVFIETTTRTPLDYLMKPMVDQMGRMFRER
jgi:HlyD family secretion protein